MPSLLLVVPLFANAQTTFGTIISKVSDWITMLVPLAISAALLFFIWGLVVFVRDSGEEEALEEGKRKMIWGIIALFVIVAVWGLVLFIANSFNINLRENAPVPDIPGSVS